MTATDTSKRIAAYDLDWSNVEAMPDEDLIQFVSCQYDAGKRRREPWEQAASERIAWVEGKQDMRWSTTRRDVDRIADMYLEGVPDAYRYPVMINMLRPAVLQRIAALLSSPTTLYAIPGSSDDDDVAAAEAQTRLLQYMWHCRSGVRRKLVWALWVTFCTGLIFIHPHWDPTVGSPERFRPDKSDGEDEKSRAAGFRRRIAGLMGKEPEAVRVDEDGSLAMPPGEVRWKWPTGFDITEPEFAASVEESDWLIHTELCSMEYLKETYGAAAEGLSPDEFTGEFLAGYRSLYGSAWSGALESEEEIEPQPSKAELIPIHRFWRPVRPWTPQGALVVMAACSTPTLLYKGPHPYPHGELPFIRMQELPGRGFRPPCSVADGMNLQESRNRNRSQISAAVHQTIAPKWLKEEGVDLPEDFLDANSRIAQVPSGAISGGRLKTLDPPQVPAQAFRLDELYRRDSQDVLGVHDSTLGRAESSSQSGRHAAIVTQGDNRLNAAPKEFIETALAEAASQSLWLWWKYVPTNRTVTIVGHGRRSAVLTFKGGDLYRRKDLTPSPADWNVRVLLGPDDSMDKLLEKLGIGTGKPAVGPTQGMDPQILARLMGQVPGAMGEDGEIQVANAQDENRRFLQGKPVFTAIGDDDEIHLREHDRFTISGEYRRAVTKNRAVRDDLEAHRAEHLMQMAAKKIERAEAEERQKRATINRLEAEAAAAEAAAAEKAAKRNGARTMINPRMAGIPAAAASAPAGAVSPPAGAPVAPGGPPVTYGTSE